MTTWTWDDPKAPASVKIAGPEGWEFDLGSPSAEELGRFEFALDRAIAIYDVLGRAKAAFEEGRADYARTIDRLDELLDGLGEAILLVVRSCAEVSRWITPRGQPNTLAAAFQGRGDDFVRFCREWIQIARAKPSGNGQAAEPSLVPGRVD